MAVAAGGLAVVLVEIDRGISPESVREIPWIFRAGASGAREVLSTIATSMVQLAAITFSVTIVALALRSQQFGPRLLRNFTGDPINQFILGAFIGTFVFSLLVLRAVRDLDNGELEEERFIPFVAVTVSIALALGSLALFVVFIDRVVSSIQANSIISATAEETRASIRRLFPEALGDGAPPDEAERYEPFSGGIEIIAEKTGYIQSIDDDGLMSLACAEDLVLRMEAPIGGFVNSGSALLTAVPADRIGNELAKKVSRLYSIAGNRSTFQDPEFGIRQMVDLAVKALSPSDNDPTTAVTATEYLGSLLAELSRRTIPSPVRRDDAGAVRVIALGPTFRSMTDLAFDQIREYGASDPAVVFALLDSIRRVARSVDVPSQRAVLREHAEKIARAADREVREPLAREAVNRRLRLALDRIGGDPTLPALSSIPDLAPESAAPS
jgi:uncharacterized membrane protein